MKNLSKAEKNLLKATISLGIAAILYGVVIEPAIIARRSVSQRSVAKVAELAKDRRLLDQYPMLEKELSRYPDLRAPSLGEEEGLAKVLSEIESLSKRSQIAIIDLKPRSSREIERHREVSIEVTAEGTIEGLSRFMYEIDTSKAVIRIRRFSLSSKADSPGTLRGIFIVRKVIF